MSLYCSPSVYAASSDKIEKYLLSLISRDKLFSMIAPTVVIISIWMVLEVYVAFLGAGFKWCCSVWSPLSIRNSNSAWKFPERLEFCGSSSRGPLHEGYVVSSAENYCREQGFENFAMSFDLLLKKVGLLINWDRFSCHISQKITHCSHWKDMHLTFSAGCLVKRDMADAHSVRGVSYNLSSLFRPHWTPNKTHGKQNALSRNLDYSSQGNIFSQSLTKWRLEFETSTDTGKSNSLPGFKQTFSMNLNLSWSGDELISLKTKLVSYREQSSFRQTGSPRTVVYRSKLLLSSRSKLTNSTRTKRIVRKRLLFIYDCQ